MIIIKLYDLLQNKAWTQHELSVRTGIREATISNMCNNTSKRLRLSTLDSICKAMKCNVEDVLEFIPER